MSQTLLFIVFRGQKIQMKVEGNSNEKHLNLEPIPSHKGSVTWFISLAPPAMSCIDIDTLELLKTTL